jgi:hypothetical protein
VFAFPFDSCLVWVLKGCYDNYVNCWHDSLGRNLLGLLMHSVPIAIVLLSSKELQSVRLEQVMLVLMI